MGWGTGCQLLTDYVPVFPLGREVPSLWRFHTKHQVSERDFFTFVRKQVEGGRDRIGRRREEMFKKDVM